MNLSYNFLERKSNFFVVKENYGKIEDTEDEWMTEKQKMLMGLLYNAEDELLLEERYRAKEMLYDLNQLRPGMKPEKKELIRNLFGRIGDSFHIESPFYCDYGYRIKIGENFFSNFNLTIIDGGGVTIGDNVFIAPNVGIYTAQHPTDTRRRNMGYEWGIPVTIGNNVWIGGDVTILPGVTIGDNVTIGGGSVVTEDIPANAIAVGNPCKVKKYMNQSGGRINGITNKKD